MSTHENEVYEENKKESLEEDQIIKQIMELAADKNCKECKGTGLIETQAICFSRHYYSKEKTDVIHDTLAYDPWEMTQCTCIGE